MVETIHGNDILPCFHSELWLYEDCNIKAGGAYLFGHNYNASCDIGDDFEQ